MAKSSFGKGFTREFRPGTVGNMFLQNLFVRQRQKERRDYLDQKEKERLDRINAIERKDASLMGQLRSATQPAGGVGTPLPEFQIPLNQKQLGNVYGQLSDKGQQRFNNLERFNERFLPPEPVKTSRDIIIGMDEIEGDVEGLKKEGYIGALVDEKLSDGKPTGERNIRQLFKRTETKTNGDGKKYTGHTKQFNKILDNAEKDLQNAHGRLDAIRSGREIWNQDIFGNRLTLVTESQAINNLETARGQIFSILQRQGSPQTQEKIAEYTGGLDGQEENFIPTLFSQLREDYLSGVFDKNLDVFSELKSFLFAKTGYSYERLNAGR